MVPAVPNAATAKIHVHSFLFLPPSTVASSSVSKSSNCEIVCVFMMNTSLCNIFYIVVLQLDTLSIALFLQK